MRKITTAMIVLIFLAMVMAMTGCASSGRIKNVENSVKSSLNYMNERLGSVEEKVDLLLKASEEAEVAETTEVAAEITETTEAAAEVTEVTEATEIVAGVTEKAEVKAIKVPKVSETLETRLAKLTTRVKANEKAIRVNKTAVTQLRTAINKVRPRLGQLEDKVAYATPQVYAFWTKSFPTGSSTLTERIKGQLDVLTEAVKTEGITIKKIVGYADTRGVAEDNETLALRRAEAVKTYLSINKGLDLTEVGVVSGGETSRYGYYKNNRCVAIIGEK